MYRKANWLYCLIEGPVASGKSSLSERLQNNDFLLNNYKIISIQENLDLWNHSATGGKGLLGDFFEDKSKGYFFQNYLLAEYLNKDFEMHQNIKNSPPDTQIIIFQEGSIYSSRFVFIPSMTLTNEERGSLENFASVIIKKITPPDVIIRLSASPEEAFVNHIRRNRPGESYPRDLFDTWYSLHNDLSLKIQKDLIVPPPIVMEHHFLSGTDSLVSRLKEALTNKYM